MSKRLFGQKITILLGALFSVLVCNSVFANPQYEWYLAAVGVTPAMHANATKRGSGVQVGMFDSPARCTHAAFGGRCSVNYGAARSKELAEAYGVDQSEAVPGSHGTHVGSTIVAGDTGAHETVGVAPGANLHSWQACNSSSPVCWPTNAMYLVGAATRDRGDAFDFFHERGVTVSNHSYGGGNSFGWGKSQYVYDKMSSAKFKNHVFVFAAGNSHLDAGQWIINSNFQPRDKLKNWIVVTALEENNKLVSFSNAPGDKGFCNQSAQVCQERNKFKYFTVSAPGNIIKAAGHLDDTSSAVMSGTSMATPIVTGVVALLQGHWPALKNDASKVTNIIFGTAQDLGAPGVDDLYGWGLVRADRAMSPLGETYLSGASLPADVAFDEPEANCASETTGSIYAPSSGSGSCDNGSETETETETESLGDIYSAARSMSRERYSLASSKLRVSPAFSALTQHEITFFDAYGRDFKMPLATYAPNYQGALENWMRKSGQPHEHVVSNDGVISTAFSSFGYDASDPSLADIGWRLSYQGATGNTLHFGQGSALDQLTMAGDLSFGVMADGNTQASAYPVMSLADGGIFGIVEQSLGHGFNVAGVGMTNMSLDSDAEDLDYAPQSQAMAISLSKQSDDQRVMGNISLSYLDEENGILGTGGSGGLEFTDESYTQAVTLGGTYQLTEKVQFVGSVTQAFSQGDTKNDRLLRLNSSSLSSSAFVVGVGSKGIFSAIDQLQFSISQPLRINGGSMSLVHDDYYDEQEVLHSRSVDIDLTPTGRQIDYQIEYTYPISKISSSLGLFAYWADDYLHQSDLASYGIGFRLKKTFSAPWLN